MSRAELLGRVGRYGAQTPDVASQADQAGEQARKEQLGEVVEESTGLLDATASIMADVAAQRETGEQDPELVSTLDRAEPVMNQAIWASKVAAGANVDAETNPDQETRIRARHGSVFTEALASTVEASPEVEDVLEADEYEESEDEGPEAFGDEGVYRDDEGTLWEWADGQWNQMEEQTDADADESYDPLQEWSDAVDERRGERTDADEAWADVA